MIVREALLLGHEARQRARVAAEQTAKEQWMILRLAGYPDPSTLQVVGIGVITPYLPPGQRSGAVGAFDEWGTPPKVKPRVKSGARTTAKNSATKGTASSSRKRTTSAAHGSDRQAPRRRASPTKRKAKAGEGDDEPGASTSTSGHPIGGPTDLCDRGGRR
jgi:hypothetical protein